MNVNEIRRWSLDLWLQSVRFPLTMTEAVIRRDDDGTWPPTMAFDTFEGTMKGLVGRVLHDDTLVELGRLQRAEISQRRRSVEMQTEAHALEVEAHRDADDKQEALEHDREVVEQHALEAKRQLEADRNQAKRAVQKRTARKTAASRSQAAARSQTVQHEATKAGANRVRKEATALRAKQRAVAAQGKAIDLDKAVRAKKSARRS
jgi:hypothetical protein